MIYIIILIFPSINRYHGRVCRHLAVTTTGCCAFLFQIEAGCRLHTKFRCKLLFLVHALYYTYSSWFVAIQLKKITSWNFLCRSYLCISVCLWQTNIDKTAVDQCQGMYNSIACVDGVMPLCLQGAVAYWHKKPAKEYGMTENKTRESVYVKKKPNSVQWFVVHYLKVLASGLTKSWLATLCSCSWSTKSEFQVHLPIKGRLHVIKQIRVEKKLGSY